MKLMAVMIYTVLTITPKPTTCQGVLQEGLGDGIDECSTDGRDDIGVDEMYSDYKTASELTRCLPVMHDNWSSDDVTSTPDNLVCPSDVIEYCTINIDTAVKRHSVKVYCGHH